MGGAVRWILAGILCLPPALAPCPCAGEGSGPALLTLARGTFLRAEHLSYSSDLLRAEGDVRLGWRDGLILADFLEISQNGSSGQGRNVRCGWDGYRMRAAEIDRSDGKIVLSRGEIFLGEPGPFSWHLAAERASAIPGQRLFLDRPSLFLGSHRLLTLAHCSLPLEESPFHLRVHAGARRDLGAFVQGEISAAPRDGLRLGWLLEAYGRRGILLGPTLLCRGTSPAGEDRDLSLRGGYIRDRLGPVRDGCDLARGPRRFFIDGVGRGNLSNWQIWGEWRRWSDSEMMRDFRSELFALHPDGVLALRRGGSAAALTFLLQLRGGNFQDVVRRLPEVRWEIFSRRLGLWNFSTGGCGELVRLRREDGREQLRANVFWELAAPTLRLAGLAALRSHLAIRVACHSSAGDATLRAAGELGLDLQGEIFGTAATEAGTALRHRCRPILQYRRLVQGRGRAPEAVDDCGAASGNRPPIDLDDPRCADLFQELHLLRLGMRSTFFCGEFREWGHCSIYRDISLPGRRTLSLPRDFYAAGALFPVHWLSLSLRGRFDPGVCRWKELYASAQIRDGMFWSLSLDGVHGHGHCGQWRLHHWLRASSRLKLNSFFSYDVRRHRPIEQCCRFQRRLGSGWALEGSIAVRGYNLCKRRCQLGASLATEF
ncbi:MAG: hypothetical protein LBT98_04135 [Puniceicoccales bacterium]|jgi:hypothetical protein|nr:hypothetical protein [Puniceicoccales bacterium]